MPDHNEIPEEIVKNAAEVYWAAKSGYGTVLGETMAKMRPALEAAAPAIRADEREKIIARIEGERIEPTECFQHYWRNYGIDAAIAAIKSTDTEGEAA